MFQDEAGTHPPHIQWNLNEEVDVCLDGKWFTAKIIQRDGWDSTTLQVRVAPLLLPSVAAATSTVRVVVKKKRWGDLGALTALYASRGLLPQLTGWLFIHGVTELLATVLAGAAGFRIGWAVMFPGSRARLDAVAAAGRTAGAAMAGVVVMLIIAGVLEGVGRQLILGDVARWTIAAISLVLWLAYFYAPRANSVHMKPCEQR